LKCSVAITIRIGAPLSRFADHRDRQGRAIAAHAIGARHDLGGSA
jgi:hypothetical protein